MKKTKRRRSEPDSMLPEYDFDYTKARPNKFASRLKGKLLTVVLEPDVARVFDTSDSVNRLLRSVISAVPGRQQSLPSRKSRRKAT